MKRHNNLFEKIISIDNFYLAYWKAKRGKEGSKQVLSFSAALDSNIISLIEDTVHGSLSLDKYKVFTIYDPKERSICEAPFFHRVVQHAFMNICGPYMDRYQIADSFASQKGKGTYAAIERAMWFHKRYDYVAKIDVRKYFDSIDHKVLKRMIYRFFKERQILSVFFQIIDGYENTPGKGLPIGNLTSQYFANHYLALLDHYAKEELRVKGYVRYMDDILVYEASLNELKEKCTQIRKFIQKELNLELKVLDIKNTKTKATQFLGYRIKGVQLLLGHRSKKRYRDKLKEYYRLYNEGVWSADTLAVHLQALTAFVKKSQCLDYRRRCLYWAV